MESFIIHCFESSDNPDDFYTFTDILNHFFEYLRSMGKPIPNGITTRSFPFLKEKFSIISKWCKDEKKCKNSKDNNPE